MFAIDWSAITDEIIRIGLIFGAIFQLICIGAAIFLPNKSDNLVENGSVVTNNKKLGPRPSEAGNDKFLEESDESDSEHTTANRRRRPEASSHQVHQRHHHHSHEETARNNSGSSKSVKKNEKKNRR